MQRESTLSMLYPAHVYLAFSLKKEKKISIYGLQPPQTVSTLEALFHEVQTKITILEVLFVISFPLMEMETSSTPKWPFIYDLHTHFAIDFAP